MILSVVRFFRFRNNESVKNNVISLASNPKLLRSGPGIEAGPGLRSGQMCHKNLSVSTDYLYWFRCKVINHKI